MGVIDKTTYLLSCERCSVEETSSILEKGSNWGGSHWQSEADFTKFMTSWKGGGVAEPTLLSATCISCEMPAGVKKS